MTQNTLMIDSDSHGDSPCKVTVYGPCTNPVWKHYVNNVLYDPADADIVLLFHAGQGKHRDRVPIGRYYVNNVLYETGRYEGNIPDGHKLVIDTTQIPYSITERGAAPGRGKPLPSHTQG